MSRRMPCQALLNPPSPSAGAHLHAWALVCVTARRCRANAAQDSKCSACLCQACCAQLLIAMPSAAAAGSHNGLQGCVCIANDGQWAVCSRLAKVAYRLQCSKVAPEAKIQVDGTTIAGAFTFSQLSKMGKTWTCTFNGATLKSTMLEAKANSWRQAPAHACCLCLHSSCVVAS